MDKADLVLDSQPEDLILKAHCSFCGARFDLTGNGLAEKQLLREIFDLHVRRIHSPRKNDNGEGEKPAHT